MSTITGLPAHILLNHFLVVLVPLTAILAILCAVWPAALQRLVWLVGALSVVVLVLAPLTTSAGEWLEHELGAESPALSAHEALGKTVLYVTIAQVLAAAALVFVHLRRTRDLAVNTMLNVAVAVVVIVISALSMVQIVRIGDSGARAVWSGVVQ